MRLRAKGAFTENLLSKKKTTIILSLVVIISLFFYAYMLTKPISYGLSYYHASMYEGDASVYFCKYAVVFAVACGAVELALICLICVSFARHKKAKNEQS